MSEHGPKKVIATDGHEYHKSATANAPTAPTNATTVAGAAKTTGLNSDQAEFVTIVDYEWNLPDGFDQTKLTSEYGFTEAEVKQFVANPLIVQALAERGINSVRAFQPKEVEAPAKVAKLSPLQLVAANALMDLTDTRSTRKKLQDLGVSSYQYNAWLNDENFKYYLQQRSEALIGNVQHEAMLALVDQVMSGNLKAIEYYHEMTGRFVKQTNKPQEANSGDLQTLIIRVVEIIIDEVHDQDEALRIADRLKGLATGMQVAGMLPQPEIITPEVAKPREITEGVQQLMDQGMGYDS